MVLRKYLITCAFYNFTICLVLSGDILSIEKTLKSVETQINHINETSNQMSPNHPDGESEILEMFEDILPSLEKFDKDSYKIVEEIEKMFQSISYEHRFDQ